MLMSFCAFLRQTENERISHILITNHINSDCKCFPHICLDTVLFGGTSLFSSGDLAAPVVSPTSVCATALPVCFN